MPRINLLPWREAERKRKRQEFFLSLGAALATAALVTLLGRWQISAAIAHQNERNQVISSEIAELDKQIEEILGLENQKRRLLARMEIIETLQRSRPEIVHVFDEIVRTLPDGVYFRGMERTGQTITIRGTAESNNRVSSLMRRLDASDWFSEPTLKGVKANPSFGEQANDFDLTVKVSMPGATAEDGEAGE